MSNVAVLDQQPPQQSADHPELKMLRVGRIRRNPNIDPRISRNTAKYQSIRDSIKQHGVQQPILVRPVAGDTDYDYEVVAGNTRWQGSVDNAIEFIPAMIRHLTDAEARVVAALENMARADLTCVEEAKHVLVVLADLNNDHEAVCRKLDWSRTKLNSRILLSHCNDDVAEALVQEQIKIGHAELLAGVPQELQSGILAKLIERNMTVAEARDRLFALSRDLSKAKFDTSACQNCPKNSATYRDLFATSLEGAMCQDTSCWDSKASALIEVKLIEAKEEFGVVHTDLNLPPNAYVTLHARGESGVGDEQFSACTACANYGAVVSTVVGNEGTVQGGLCFDKACNGTMRKQYQDKLKALAAPASAPATQSGVTSNQATIAGNTSHASVANSKGTEAKAQVPAMRKGMRRQAFNLYAQMGQQAVKNNMNLALSVAITSLYFDVRSDLSLAAREQIEKGLGFSSMSQKDKRAKLEISLASKPVEELTILMQKLAAVTVFRTDSGDQFENSMSGSQSLAFIEFTGMDPKDHFLMSAEYLKTLTKAGIIEELKRSGFEAKYNEVKGEKAFKQLSTSGVDQMITDAMAFKFDWKGYVPVAIEIATQKSAGTGTRA
jgi:ParB family transcriptional regulator, chromosome partitioning protein